MRFKIRYGVWVKKFAFIPRMIHNEIIWFEMFFEKREHSIFPGIDDVYVKKL